MVMINSSSSNPLVYSSAAFSTASYVAMQSKKFNDLAEYCVTILNTKIPKLWTKVKILLRKDRSDSVLKNFEISKEQINERVKKNGGQTVYNSWIVNEFNQLSNLINTIKNNLIVSRRLFSCIPFGS
jgi:hypothetical protein